MSSQQKVIKNAFHDVILSKIFIHQEEDGSLLIQAILGRRARKVGSRFIKPSSKIFDIYKYVFNTSV